MDQVIQANAVLSMFCKNYMELKKALPVRPSEMGVLNILSETPGPHTSVLLSELLQVSKPMITAHLSSLQEKGYIVKAQYPSDKRVYHVSLTEAGRALVEREKQALARQLEVLKDGMGEAEFEALVSLARRANDVLAGENKR